MSRAVVKKIGSRPLNKSPENQSQSKSWFLGIGIDSYKEFDPLNNAVRDMNCIRKLLIDKYDVEGKYALTITDRDATRENIIGKLIELKHEVDTEDKLLIYYSGHGHFDGEMKWGYWIPHDAKEGKMASYIRNSTIREIIGVLKGKHILLISDSCCSGSIFYRGGTRSSLAIDELAQRTSRWAICSGRHDEEVADGPPGGHSPFAESILEELRHNERSKLNVAKLADRVIELTRANYEQLPEGSPLYGVGHKGGQYVFQLKNRNNPVQDPTFDGSAKSIPPLQRNHPFSKKWLISLVILSLFIIVGIIGLQVSGSMKINESPQTSINTEKRKDMLSIPPDTIDGPAGSVEMDSLEGNESASVIIKGKVWDEYKSNRIERAQVTLTNYSGDILIITQSDNEGNFQLSPLEIENNHRFTISVFAKGYRKWTKNLTSAGSSLDPVMVTLEPISSPEPQPLTTSIKGKVQDEYTSNGIGHAQVFLTHNFRDTLQTTQTDSKGNFRFSPLGVENNYLLKVSVSAKGYKDRAMDIDLHAASDSLLNSVQVTLRRIPGTLIIYVPRTGKYEYQMDAGSRKVIESQSYEPILFNGKVVSIYYNGGKIFTEENIRPGDTIRLTCLVNTCTEL